MSKDLFPQLKTMSMNEVEKNFKSIKDVIDVGNRPHYLYTAAVCGRLDIIKYFVEKLEVLPTTSDFKAACWANHTEVAKYLTKYTYNLGKGLNYALMNKNSELSTFLLEKIDMIDYKTYQGLFNYHSEFSSIINEKHLKYVIKLHGEDWGQYLSGENISHDSVNSTE